LDLGCFRGDVGDLYGLSRRHPPGPECLRQDRETGELVGHRQRLACRPDRRAGLGRHPRRNGPEPLSPPRALSVNVAVAITRSAPRTRSASAHCSTNRAATEASSLSTSTPPSAARINGNSSSSGLPTPASNIRTSIPARYDGNTLFSNDFRVIGDDTLLHCNGADQPIPSSPARTDAFGAPVRDRHGCATRATGVRLPRCGGNGTPECASRATRLNWRSFTGM